MFLSRLSRNRHSSLEQSLATITQSVSNLTMKQHSGIVTKVSSIVLDVPSNDAAFRAEEWDAMKSFPGQLQPTRSDYSVANGSWGKQTWIKRTLRRKSSVMEYFLGTIRAESNIHLRIPREADDLTPYCEQKLYEHETSYTIYPATWLIHRGIQYGLRLRWYSSFTQGWKTTLKAFYPVPDNAVIFEFCKQGNVPAVRTLLSGGLASVRDTDSRGYTPLHVSLVRTEYFVENESERLTLASSLPHRTAVQTSANF